MSLILHTNKNKQGIIMYIYICLQKVQLCPQVQGFQGHQSYPTTSIRLGENTTIYSTNMVLHNSKEPNSHLRSRHPWLSWATRLSRGSLSSHWSVSSTLTRGTLWFKRPLLVFQQQQFSTGPWTAPPQCIKQHYSEQSGLD